MPLIWIEEVTGEIVNSGWLQAAEQAIEDAEQGLAAAVGASVALISGAIQYFFGSFDAAVQAPVCFDCNDGAGNVYTFGLSWNGPFGGGQGSYPPGI